MTSTRLRVFAVTALLSVAGAVLGSGQDTTLQEIAGYRQWTRLTPTPVRAFTIDGSSDWSAVLSDLRVGDVPLDAPSKQTPLPMPGVSGSSESRSVSTSTTTEATHGSSSFGVVYVNGPAHEALKLEPPIRFPRGSIIVRERLAKADEIQPQRLVVMIKRAPGFNPGANDWEFLMVNGAMTKIQERQKKGSCLGCHVSQKERDFVYPITAEITGQ